MKKIIVLLSVLFLTLGLAMPVWAQNDKAQQPETKVQLTEAQKKELADIHEDILENKLELIDKHVEFGIITKEKGDMIKAKIQEKAKKMKENGYMPGACKYGHHKGREMRGEGDQ
ncbi:YckD family protein [Schinkia azotoformans]|uniref:YckD family protein n=1 Tax=Schinkia azotoformans TaxID=1454 RepID=UPI002DBDDF8F|nr:YckD family protein [Schinkia azotoformans]MEC1719482.1 YckD family protein [Schinkia azotoformans]MED4351228.1 YckD family protein [Schinkia azotoformans]MED4413786.1 YckD family protein [Schinkia azotoformans]